MKTLHATSVGPPVRSRVALLDCPGGSLRMTWLRASVLACVLCVGAPASAQCLSWDVNHTGSASTPWCSIVADIGSGPEPILGTDGGVTRWNGAAWVPLGSGGPVLVRALAVFDGGAGPRLFAGGNDLVPLVEWNGTSWAPVGGGVNGLVNALAIHDDGSGLALFVAGHFTTAGGQPAGDYARWNGSAWSALPASTSFHPSALHAIGSGPLAGLYAGGSAYVDGPTTRLARWNGTSWSAVGSGVSTDFTSVECFAVFDAGSGEELYVGGQDGLITFPLTWPALMKWNGSAWTSLSSNLFQGSPSFGHVAALLPHDDGGAPALYAGGNLAGGAAGAFASGLLRFDGSAWAGAAGGVTGSGADVWSLSVWDDGTGHGPGLLVGGDFAGAGGSSAVDVAVLEGCRIATFCAGDGLDPNVTVACPCGNFGAAGRGCAWSAGPAGALLAASGPIAPQDGLLLSASGMPATSTAVFFQGSTAEGGVVFGDGLRCAGGSVVRLRTRACMAGAATYPEATDPPVSIRGGIPVGSGILGTYQVQYRNAAAFCTAATSNATNAVRVVW